MFLEMSGIGSEQMDAPNRAVRMDLGKLERRTGGRGDGETGEKRRRKEEGEMRRSVKSGRSSSRWGGAEAGVWGRGWGWLMGGWGRW